MFVTSLLQLTAFFTYSQSWLYPPPVQDRGREVRQFNELGNVTGHEVCCNHLVLNGRPLDYYAFSLESKGKLQLVKGGSETSEAIRIPFTIQLRREGKIIDLTPAGIPTQDLFEIEISKILALGREGDQLIITPVHAIDVKAKRILKLLPPGC